MLLETINKKTMAFGSHRLFTVLYTANPPRSIRHESGIPSSATIRYVLFRL